MRDRGIQSVVAKSPVPETSSVLERSSFLRMPSAPGTVSVPVIFSGRFGSGKTEVALNYALSVEMSARRRPPAQAKRGNQDRESCVEQPAQPRAETPAGVILIDLDIVTPYFRSRETADRMKGQGVEVVAPAVIGQHLDIPAITPEIRGAIEQAERPVILDVGGDRQGARALGQFSHAIRLRGYTMHFVVNPYRPFTDTLAGLSDSIAEIEASARLQVSSLVSNPNLMLETTAEHIVEGHAKIERFALALRLPIAFVCIERQWVQVLSSNHFAQPILALDRQFVMPWE